jgi:hypothetical protein
LLGEALSDKKVLMRGVPMFFRRSVRLLQWRRQGERESVARTSATSVDRHGSITFSGIAYLALPTILAVRMFAAALAIGFLGPSAAEAPIDAEPFEYLIEQAFSAKGARLDALIRHVERLAERAQALLPDQARTELWQRISDIQQARRANRQSEIVLAAMEGFRIVANEIQETKVPKPVSMLDYAGFRYDAHLKSSPPRWSDMLDAVQMAQNEWDSISGQVSDVKLRKSIDVSLENMARAASMESPKAASIAAQTELSLVDKLERYFKRL